MDSPRNSNQKLKILSKFRFDHEALRAQFFPFSLAFPMLVHKQV
jgi:hypothetical protein